MKLLDKPATLSFFGGTKPINSATLYRGMKAGRYPRPINVGPNMVRWVESECEEALKALLEQRDGKKTETAPSKVERAKIDAESVAAFAAARTRAAGA